VIRRVLVAAFATKVIPMFDQRSTVSW